MRVYIGYILGDYSVPFCMSADKNKVDKAVKETHKRTGCLTWVESREVNKDTLINLDCN